MSKENMPTVIDLKPQGGQASLDTEVWIKGKGFTGNNYRHTKIY
jgi:hypothetical protein